MAKRYRAIRNCHYKGFFYIPGMEYGPTPEELRNPETIPEHFVAERDFSDELVEEAETEDRNRQVFIQPAKASDPPAPAAL